MVGTLGKPKLIRKINRKLVLRSIRENKIISKKELYKLTGLSKPTINHIVSSLIQKNLVLEAGYGESTEEGGRKPLLLKFNYSAYFLIGILVGEKKIRCAVTNLKGDFLLEITIDAKMQKGHKDVIERIIKLLKDIIKKSDINQNKFLGIGIGLPGIVDFNNGIVKTLTRFPKWKNVPLKKIIQKEFNIPVIIDHKGNVRALGDKWFGLGKKENNFISIMTTDNGIGSGVVINKEIYRGKNFLCGEIGHMLLGTNSSSQNFENVLSKENISKLVSNSVYENGIKSSFFNKYKKNKAIPLKVLFNYLNGNKENEFSKIIIDKIAQLFAIGISNIICIFDIDIIIIHGKFALLDDYFYEKIEEIISKIIFPNIEKEIKIKRSLFNKQMGLKGAASVVLDVIDI